MASLAGLKHGSWVIVLLILERLNIALQWYLGVKRCLGVLLRPKVSIWKGLGLFQYW